MLRRPRFSWVIPFVLFLLLVTVAVPDDAFAQGAPATIKGTVRDKETGELLDYANVLLAGTTRGTMSLGGGSRSCTSVLHPWSRPSPSSRVKSRP